MIPSGFPKESVLLEVDAALPPMHQRLVFEEDKLVQPLVPPGGEIVPNFPVNEGFSNRLNPFARVVDFRSGFVITTSLKPEVELPKAVEVRLQLI